MAVTSGLSVSRNSYDSTLQRAAFGLGTVLAAGAGRSWCSSGCLVRTARICWPIPTAIGTSRSATGSWRTARCRRSTAIPSPSPGQPWIAKEWLSQLVLALRLQCRRLGRGGRCSAPASIGLSFALMMRLLLRDIRAPLAASVHGGRRAHDGAAPAGAPARARLPGHADLGVGAGARGRGTPRAAAAPAARHAGMGQPAWRLHVRTAAVRRLRARGRDWRARFVGTKAPVRRMGEVRHRRRAGRLHHAVWAGVDAGHVPHLQSRRCAGDDQRMEVARLP